MPKEIGPKRSPQSSSDSIHDNLANLGLNTLDVVNLRVGGLDAPEPGSIAQPFSVLAEMQQEGLIKHLGVSTVNAEQVAEAQSIAPVVCVQNFYNIANRRDDSLKRMSRSWVVLGTRESYGSGSSLFSSARDA